MPLVSLVPLVPIGAGGGGGGGGGMMAVMAAAVAAGGGGGGDGDDMGALLQRKRDAVKERRAVARDLHNAKRRRERLREAARGLSDNDLVSLIQERAVPKAKPKAKAKAKAKAKHG